jgi:hypothetical protein
MAVMIRCADHTTSSIHKVGTNFADKRWFVCIVRSQTKATEFSLVLVFPHMPYRELRICRDFIHCLIFENNATSLKMDLEAFVCCILLRIYLTDSL